MREKILLFVLCMFLGVGVFLSAAEEFHAVIYNGFLDKGRGLGNYPEISLQEEFEIVEHRYWPTDDKAIECVIKGTDMTKDEWKEKYKDIYKPLDNTFIENLKKSKFLYIGQYCGDQCMFLFNKQEYAGAIKEFLKQGGTIFFDYLGHSPTLNSFFNSISVENPSYEYKALQTGYYKAIISPENRDHVLLNSPNKITGELNTYGWWEKWSDKQIVLFRNSSLPEKSASMLIQQNVLDKGTIIFNQVSSIFRKTTEGRLFLENILSYVYGTSMKEYKKKKMEELGGPGETIE